MTYDEAKLLVFEEMDRTWPNPCRICGAKPEFRIEPNHEWMVRCPNWDDDEHRGCLSFPHSAYCADRDILRQSWNRSHPVDGTGVPKGRWRKWIVERQFGPEHK